MCVFYTVLMYFIHYFVYDIHLYNKEYIQDPEKQRKMEERENRKEKKKNAPKMKQLKVKAM